MLRILFVIVALLWSVEAQAQSNVIVNYKSGTTSATQVSPSNPLPVYTVPSPSVGGVTKTSTAALASNLIVKATAGNLYAFEVSADSTLSAAAWWIMVFDAVSLPSNGSVTPAKCYAVPSGTTLASFGWNTPVAFATGMVIGVSTNGCFTLAASAHAFISGDYQ